MQPFKEASHYSYHPRKIPRDASNEAVGPRLEERWGLQKFYHDRSARQLPDCSRSISNNPRPSNTEMEASRSRRKAHNGTMLVYGKNPSCTRTLILEVPQSNQEVKPDLGGQNVSCTPSSAADDSQDIPGTQVLTGPGSYLTRSRRVVKPSERLDM